MLVSYPALKSFSKRIDPRYYNGASLLGLKGLCIKSHGGTDGIGFANAIGVAADLAINRFTEKVEAELEKMEASVLLSAPPAEKDTASAVEEG
jgi:glycerol-3-phosphate acyltransferase PlsX